MNSLIFVCPLCKERFAEIFDNKLDIIKEGILQTCFQCPKCLHFLQLRIKFSSMALPNSNLEVI